MFVRKWVIAINTGRLTLNSFSFFTCLDIIVHSITFVSSRVFSPLPFISHTVLIRKLDTAVNSGPSNIVSFLCPMSSEIIIYNQRHSDMVRIHYVLLLFVRSIWWTLSLAQTTISRYVSFHFCFLRELGSEVYSVKFGCHESVSSVRFLF